MLKTFLGKMKSEWTPLHAADTLLRRMKSWALHWMMESFWCLAKPEISPFDVQMPKSLSLCADSLLVNAELCPIHEEEKTFFCCMLRPVLSACYPPFSAKACRCKQQSCLLHAETSLGASWTLARCKLKPHPLIKHPPPALCKLSMCILQPGQY